MTNDGRKVLRMVASAMATGVSGAVAILSAAYMAGTATTVTWVLAALGFVGFMANSIRDSLSEPPTKEHTTG